MAEEKPTLHIDTDWKRQAQEEKQRLAEEEAKKAAEAAAQPPAAAASPSAASGAGAARPGTRQRGEGVPQATFATLVHSLLTQALFYLGDIAARGMQPTVNLDMAKHQIDTLGILEEKTRNNLSEEEKKLLDTALYEARMRFVSVAAQYVG